ncbi:MAG: betaine/proline/choline family ABC transporter ATP-binding protein, partial [Actinomycetia bacterium]|nr:betaine/proline/choline family ABC transporter ATP-binding protein [Actinomycetes bacterium]
MSTDHITDTEASTDTIAASLVGTDIYKVFGPKPQRALEMAAQGVSRDEILQTTGNTVAVRDVSFEVNPGETFVVMGLSGSGKSTLVRCIARLVDVTQGHVYLDGADLTAMNDKELRTVRRQNMSMVFQHFGLFPHRRVIDNVAYGLEVQGVAKATRHEKALEVLDMVGLGGWGDHYPQQLSGGMQQRVGLGRALAVEPEVLFFDEPFSALDPLIRRDMQDELLRLQAELHRTTMFITHDFDEAIKLGDRIAIMKDGAFDQVGTALELLASPATDYVREFTEDVSRTKVLAAGNVMKPHTDEVIHATVGADRTIDEILSTLLAATDEIGVTDTSGSLVGIVDRDAVITLLEV